MLAMPSEIADGIELRRVLPQGPGLTGINIERCHRIHPRNSAERAIVRAGAPQRQATTQNIHQKVSERPKKKVMYAMRIGGLSLPELGRGDRRTPFLTRC